jgi:hypothetical protein
VKGIPACHWQIAKEGLGIIHTFDNMKDEKKKSMIISATGTGKTVLSALDVKQIGAKRMLFDLPMFSRTCYYDSIQNKIYIFNVDLKSEA